MQSQEDKTSSKKKSQSVSHRDLLADMTKYRSNAASMVSLLHGNRLSVLPEYIHQNQSKSIRRMFKGKESLVAMELIGLWMPNPPGESNNFIPRYEISPYDTTRFSSKYYILDAHSFKNHPHEEMHSYFLRDKVQNLGALSFLNLFLGGTFSSSALGIAVSETTLTPYFTIRSCLFWSDLDDLTKRSFSKGKDILKYISSGNAKSWWERVIGEITPVASTHLMHLFLEEIFPLVVRIHLTPDLIIDKIVKKILGVNEVSNYLINYISMAKKTIVSEYIECLEPYDKELWNLFLKNKALESYLNYEIDIEKYLQINELYIYSDPLEWQLPMYKCAFYLGIANIEESRLVLLTRSEDVLVRVHFLGVINEIMEERWSVVSRFSDDPYWHLANINCIDLHEEMTIKKFVIESSESSINFQFYLLMVAIKYQYNDLAKFLINQFHFLVQTLIKDSDYLTPDARMYIGQSLIFYCNQVNNKVIFDLLVEKGAILELPVVAKKAHSSTGRRARRGSFFENRPDSLVASNLLPSEDLRPQKLCLRERSKKVYNFSEIADDLEMARQSILGLK